MIVLNKNIAFRTNIIEYYFDLLFWSWDHLGSFWASEINFPWSKHRFFMKTRFFLTSESICWLKNRKVIHLMILFWLRIRCVDRKICFVWFKKKQKHLEKNGNNYKAWTKATEEIREKIPAEESMPRKDYISDNTWQEFKEKKTGPSKKETGQSTTNSGRKQRKW